MNKYFLIYYVSAPEVNGLNSTQIKLNYEINKRTIKRVEIKLRKALNADKVTILRYKKVEE